jgi:hypothetical protein
LSGRTPQLQAPAPDERALGALEALEALLLVQRKAMTAGDLAGLEQSQTRIHALLGDAAWRHEAARSRSPARLRTALKSAAINAGLAARGEAHAARALSALGATPGLYTPSGGLSGGSYPPAGPARGLSA